VAAKQDRSEASRLKISAVDDEDAIRQAVSFCDGLNVELWGRGIRGSGQAAASGCRL